MLTLLNSHNFNRNFRQEGIFRLTLIRNLNLDPKIYKFYNFLIAKKFLSINYLKIKYYNQVQLYIITNNHKLLSKFLYSHLP